MTRDANIIVSVQCLAYNHAKYIRQCLDGFVMQKTNFAFEVIIHDDASTDGTADIIREYERLYPDIIKPIYQTENQYSKGIPGYITNLVTQQCKGKYIAICEGDDYWIDPLKLQKQVDALESHPDCTIAYCRVQKINKQGEILRNQTIPRKSQFEEGIVTFKDFCCEEFFNGYWCFHTSSFLFRQQYYQQTKERGEFSSVFPYGDMPAQLWCLLHGNGYFVDDVGSCYRIMSGGYNSMMKSNPEKAILAEQKLIDALLYLNKYTDFKYDYEIGRKIRRSNIIINSLRGNYKEILTPKYIWFWYNKPRFVFTSLGKMFLPSLYYICRDAFRKLKR